MFKRVDRRRKRKEEEEELGLDEDEREVLGLNNTDSSESDSDSSSSSSTQAPSGRSTPPKNKRKRRISLPPHDKIDDEEETQSTSGDEVVDGEDIVSDHLLSIASALKEPIQLIRTHPEAWVCVFCPNKSLKHGVMVKVHEASQIHRRRLKRIRELSMDFSPDESVRTLLRFASERPPKADDGTLSRRAEHRKAKQAKLKERRQRTKEKKAAAVAIAKAKKASKETETEDKQRPADTDETRALKRLKATPSEVTTKITSRPSASPQAEVRKRTKSAKKASKETETEVRPQQAGTDETRPSKRLKANSSRATTKITSRPSASPRAEVRNRSKAAHRSKKQPQTNDGTMSA